MRKGKFFFGNHEPIIGEIIYAPAASGDCWIVKSPPQREGEQPLTFYIQQFDYMVEYPHVDSGAGA